MKQITIYAVLALLIFIAGKLVAQKTTIPQLTLQEKTAKTELIFEGRLISSKAFRSGHGISTCNYYLVSREFKGVFPSDTIRMITDGGTLDGETETVSETYGLPSNGIFFCNSMSAGYYNFGSGSVYYPINAEQGFISYFPGRIQCGSEIYKDLVKDVYQPIEQLVGHPCKQVGLSSFEQAIIDDNAKRELQKKEDDANQLASETIFYIISNVTYHYDTTVKPPVKQFGIFVNTNYSPKLFVGGDIYIDYDTTAYGINIIAQKRFTAQLADVSHKAYSLIISDFAPGVIKCSVISDTTHFTPDLLDTIALGKRLRLLHCTIRFDGVKNRHYQLRLDKTKLQGQSKYYDLERKSILKFSQVFPMNQIAL